MMTWALVSMVKDSKGGYNHDPYHHNRALLRKLFSCIVCPGSLPPGNRPFEITLSSHYL